MFSIRDLFGRGSNTAVQKSFFCEVEVNFNEVWYVWHDDETPLAFPTHTFEIFARSAFDKDTYSKFSLATFSDRIVPLDPRARARHKKKSHRDLDVFYSELNQALSAWKAREPLLFHVYSKPSFFGNDAVKAMRASIDTGTSLGRNVFWQHVSIPGSTTGTLISQWPKGTGGLPTPLLCIPDGDVKSVEDRIDAAFVNTREDRIDLKRIELLGKYALDIDVLPAFLLARQAAEPTPNKQLREKQFWFRLLVTELEDSTIEPDVDWNILFEKFLPGHFRRLKLTYVEPPPMINATPGSDRQKQQVLDLYYWAYRVGVLCLIYTWVGGELRRGALFNKLAKERKSKALDLPQELRDYLTGTTGVLNAQGREALAKRLNLSDTEFGQLLDRAVEANWLRIDARGIYRRGPEVIAARAAAVADDRPQT